MSVHQRGEVVWNLAVFADYDRPFLLVSTDRHPNHGEAYIWLAITTTEIADALQSTRMTGCSGELPEPSYVKPWNPRSINDEIIPSVTDVLRESLVDEAVAELTPICGGSVSVCTH